MDERRGLPLSGKPLRLLEMSCFFIQMREKSNFRRLNLQDFLAYGAEGVQGVTESSLVAPRQARNFLHLQAEDMHLAKWMKQNTSSTA